MPQVTRTDRAELDLIEIMVHLGARSKKALDRFAQGLNKSSALHARFPGMGVACSELAPGLRRCTVENYAVFFHPIPDGIEIVRIVHGSRDFPSLFQKDSPAASNDESSGEDEE